MLCLLLALAAVSDTAPEIVVTGARKPEPVLRQAGSAARLEGLELRELDAELPLEALRQLPGVGFHQNNGVENLPSIRSPVLTGGAAAGSVLVLEDGVPIRAPGFGNVNQLFETNTELAAALELIRGPGSALHGANAVIGVVNALTPTAREAPEISLALEAGSFGHRSARALVSRGPVFLGASLLDQDGYRFDASLDLQKLLIGADLELAGAKIAWRAAIQNLDQETAGFIEGPDAFRDPALARSNPTPDAFRDQTLARTQAAVQIPISPRLELQLTPFARWIDTELALSFLPSEALERTGQFGGGVLSALYWRPNAALSLIAGFDVDRTQARLSEVQTRPTIGTFVQGLHYDYRVDSLAAAVFGQADLQLGRWSLAAGLRGERVAFAYDNQAPVGDFGRFRRVEDRRDAFLTLAPKFGVSRTLGERGALFFSYRRGSRPPQAADLYSLQTQQVAGEQGAELTDQVEGGARLALSGARLELVGFWSERRRGSFRNADGFTVTDAHTRSVGAEAAYTVPLGLGFTLEGWVTRAEHTYRFADEVRSPTDVIRVGAAVDTAPRRLAQTGLSWRPVARASLGLDWRHVGGYFTDAANTQFQEGFSVVELRGQARLSERLFLQGSLRNLLNARFPERADFAFGSERFFPGEPRAFRIGLRYES